MRSVGRSAPLHPLGDGMREGSHPLALSRGCSTGKVGFRRNRQAARLEQQRMFFRACSVEDFDLRRSRAAVLVETLVSDDAGVGRSAPLYPSGTGCERVHTLSRSPGGCSIGKVGFRRNRRAARLGQRRTYFRGWSDETLVPDETGGRRVWNGGAYFFVSVRSKVSTSDEAVVLFWRKLWFPTTQAWGALLPYTPSGTGCERVATLSRSPEGCSTGKVGFRRDRGACSSAPVRSKVSTSDEAVVLFWRELWFPTTRAWGALLPYTPSRTGCERVHTLSRSPGDVRPETLVSDETGGRRVLNSGAYFSCLFGRRFRPSTKPWCCSGGNFGFRGRRRGALRSPTPPRATGAQTKFWFLTEQAGGAFGAAAHVLPRLFGRRFRPPTKPWGCSGGNSGSRRRGRGALCSPTPLRGRGARGFTPSRALPGAARSERLVSDGTSGRRVWNSGACSSAPVRSKVSTSDEAVGLFWWKLWFPTTRAWDAPLPYTPSGTGCERVHTLSRSPGAVRSEVLVSGGTGGRRIPSAAVRSQLRLSRKCPWRSFGNGSG